MKKTKKPEHKFKPDDKISFGMGGIRCSIEFVDYVDNVYILDKKVNYYGQETNKFSFSDGDRIFNPAPKISFDDIDPKYVEVLKENGIKEYDLFNYRTDLYIGCKNKKQAENILSNAIFRAVSNIFVPQKESDMQKYPCAVDLAFGYWKYHDLK